MREWMKRHRRELLFFAIDFVINALLLAVLTKYLSRTQFGIVAICGLISAFLPPFAKGLAAGFLGYKHPESCRCSDCVQGRDHE